MTIAGCLVRSTTREARIPITPRCHPSPSITLELVNLEAPLFFQAALDLLEHVRFGLLPLAVQTIELRQLILLLWPHPGW